MPLKYTSTAQVAQLRGVKILVYGRSGVGKTVLCATAPRPLIISAEAGLLSLSPKNLQRVIGRAPDIPVVEITTIDDLTEVYDALVGTPNDFDTICLDSVSEIAERVLAHALTKVNDPRQGYGELLEKMTMVLKAFRDMEGKHVVFVAKQEHAKEGMTPLHNPAMPGSKLGQQMPYLFDEVFHLDVAKTNEGDTYRFLQTQPSLEFDAKDRSGALDNVEPPDLTVVIEKIQKQCLLN